MEHEHKVELPGEAVPLVEHGDALKWCNVPLVPLVPKPIHPKQVEQVEQVEHHHTVDIHSVHKTPRPHFTTLLTVNTHPTRKLLLVPRRLSQHSATIPSFFSLCSDSSTF